MTRLEAIRESKQHWWQNLYSTLDKSFPRKFDRSDRTCTLCAHYGDCLANCEECPLTQIGERCGDKGSVWKSTVSRTPGSCQAMIDALTKCEEIELKRLEDERMRTEKCKKEEPPKYRALKDGTGYEKGDIYTAINHKNMGTIYAGYSPQPIFLEHHLQNSPDFEEVEELWEPKERESYQFLDGFRVQEQQPWNLVGLELYRHRSKRGLTFRYVIDAQNCLDEITELIKKRSKESRKL